MDVKLKEEFAQRWKKYFGEAEMPIAMYYANEIPSRAQEPEASSNPHQCVVCLLNQVRAGSTLAFSRETVRCGGGKRYLGYVEDFDAYHAHIEKFLSETERYKPNTEIVRAFFKASVPEFHAPARYCVFSPWESLSSNDKPELLIFFATPDVMSGLFGLANYDRPDADGVVCPWGSGCSSIVLYPYLQLKSSDPRAVLGMFDPSARPCVHDDELTLTVPFPLFERMAAQMDDTFLTTGAWNKVRKRMK